MKARVSLYGKPMGFAYVDTEATKGATLGTNLYWSDGSLVSESALSAAISAATAPTTPTAAGNDLLPTVWDYLLQVPPNVQALEDATGTGLFAVTGASTGAFRSLVQPAAGLTIANDDGVAGDPTFALANDLAAVEGLSGTGLAVRTASDTWTTRTLTGTADRLTVDFGDGTAGNPTFDIAATYAGQTSITTLGTIATGVWEGTDVGLAHGGTGADYSTVAANTFWRGPTTGADAAPTFGVLVADDIPDLSGTYQPLDATLTAFAALTIAADSLTIGTGADAFSQTTFAANTFPAKASTGSLVAKTITDFGLSLVDDATASDARTTLGAEATITAGTTAQFWRGDKTFTNTLLGQIGINAAPTTGAQVSVANNGSGTNQFGVYVAAQSGATNNYALHLNNAAATNVWNVYSLGTANNYFGGRVGFGTTDLALHNVYINRSVTGGSTASNLLSRGTVQSDVTSTAMMFYSLAATAASAFTLTNLIHYRADQSTIGAGSTVTNQYGVRIEASLTGGTNNSAFWHNIASATGRIGFHGAGTADNVYAGNSSFGKTTAPAAKVDIAAGSATAGTAPLKFTSGTALTAAVAGVMEYDNSLWFTQSDAIRRYVAQATNATKTTAGAPYANDGYITIRIGGTDVKVMTTA